MRYLPSHRWRRLLLLSISFLAVGYFCGAQETKKADTPVTVAPAEAAPAAAASAASDLPPYMTAASPDPDPSKALWPDPTGANAGYWATPAPGPVGDGNPK